MINIPFKICKALKTEFKIIRIDPGEPETSDKHKITAMTFRHASV